MRRCAAEMKAWSEIGTRTSMAPRASIASASTTRPRASTTAGNAVVGGTQQGQSVFHRANLRLPEMLVRPGRVAEPGIVGDIHNKLG